MDAQSPDSQMSEPQVQGELFLSQAPSAAGPVDEGYWLREQLASALQRLVRTVNTLVYTRNPVALAVATQQCNQVEHLLEQLQQTFECCAVPGSTHDRACGIDELTIVEAHQMLAEARRLVSVPLRPVWREDNVVELQPDYGDLTDAAFERMLASSDIPQLLSSPESWVNDPGYSDSLEEKSEASKKPAPRLKLVYSSDNTVPGI